jgi:hypothetical protein
MLKLANRALAQSEEEVMEVLGTVREIVGKGGTIYPTNVNNLMNVNKRLLITLEDATGNKEVLLTSPAVNSRLRSKEVSLAEVLDYPIYLTNITDQETGMVSERAVIGVHQGAAVTSMAVSADTKPVGKKETSVSNLEAYIRF